MKPVHIAIGAVSAFALMLCSCVCIALLLPALQAAREAARRSACSSQFKQIGLAMHNYHSAYKWLPPGSGGTGIGATERDGNSNRLSGLVALLPFMEQQPLWEEIAQLDPNTKSDFPPMGPVPWYEGYAPFATPVPTFICPSSNVANYKTAVGTSIAFCYGDAVANVGMSEAQILDSLGGRPDLKPPTPQQAAIRARAQHRGMFSAYYPFKFRDVLDGLAYTIAMTEISRDEDALRANANVAGGIDGLIDSPANCLATLDRGSPNQFSPSTNVLDGGRGFRWADGHIRITGMTTVLPPNSASCSTTRSEFEGVYSASSLHFGGCHVLMADGAVIYITDSIESGSPSAPSITFERTPGNASPYGLWGKLGTRASKERIEEDLDGP